ncbi:MAG: serine/threonine-protein phosphatase, partial [Leptospiraceae bacterium]|nr:serine/threonine-protein phosphatase [Leptospiraceae bacterium]
SSYFTCILLDIDPTENKIYYASAGHNDQVVLGKEKFLKLSSTGKLMGVTEDVEYKEEIVEFLPEDKLILFTDGMFEELNEKDEEYGEERFLKFLSGQNNNTSESIIENAKNEIKNFLSESFQRDDMTIIVVDRVKE